jgi:hypothetical protein
MYIEDIKHARLCVGARLETSLPFLILHNHWLPSTLWLAVSRTVKATAILGVTAQVSLEAAQFVRSHRR